MSVGHVARAAEAAGIPTVVIQVSAFRYVAEDMKLPRVVITHHPFGRPLGPVGDAARHRAVIEAAFELLESATAGGTVVDMPGRFDA